MNKVKRFLGLFLTSPWMSLLFGIAIYLFFQGKGMGGLFLFVSLLVAMIPIGLLLIYFRSKLEKKGMI